MARQLMEGGTVISDLEEEAGQPSIEEQRGSFEYMGTQKSGNSANVQHLISPH